MAAIRSFATEQAGFDAGHDSVIGSNVWLTSSVQPDTTVLLEKPNLRMGGGLPDELRSEIDDQM